MSGGVDSSVAAAILKRRGHDVIGVTLQIWQESQRDPRRAGCCSLGAVEDARRVARALGIPHYVVDYQEPFRHAVIEDFVAEYAAGRTPNPCAQCNRKVKFDALLRQAQSLGCDRLATGHYARVRRDRASGRHRLLRARDPAKDQSYVLCMLGQEALARVAFPLGELSGKAETRSMASKLGLHLAQKPDSQEICFVSEAGGYREFLRKARPDMFVGGEVVDARGDRIGAHAGVAGFTVGQRRGIGLTARGGKPLFVLRLEPDRNRVVVGGAEELLRRDVALREVVWPSGEAPDGPVRVTAKVRSNMDARPATLLPGPPARIEFDEPVRAIAPGQVAVAYRGQTVLAGGTIL
jgi:tRNA-specific 2-thiouridylase